MMEMLRKVFGKQDVQPITHANVVPAEKDPGREAEVNMVVGKLAEAVTSTIRTGVQVRKELAASTLRIVAGD